MTIVQWVEQNFPAVQWRGSEGTIRCPFHDDQHPSCGVNVDKEVYLCHACGAKGKLSDLAPDTWDPYPGGNGNGNGHGMRERSRFDYRDPSGKVLYQVVRFEPKDFRQFNPAAGLWSIKSLQRVPYRLPELLAAIGAGRPVWIAEGEKDVLSLVALGLDATCNAGGCGSASVWKGFAEKYFPAGTRVFLCGDADEPGQKLMKEIGGYLTTAGCEVLRVDLGYPITADHGKDVSDWIGEGHAKEDLLALADDAPHFTAEDEAESQAADPQPLALTDMGNGFAFAKDHGADLRFCTKLDDGHGGGWYHFDGMRWARDCNQIVPALAKKTIRAMFDAAWPGRNKGLAKHALSSASNSRILAMLAQARSVAGIPIMPEELDSDPWLLNVQNGTIDLRTGDLRPHRKEDMITMLARASFDPGAECPRWRLFLDEIMDGDANMIRFLQKLLGYCLTGEMREDKYFMFWGKGCNGKSILAETDIAIMGDYASAAAEQTFLLSRNDRINADLARIYDKRLVFTSEISRGQKLNESLIKRWTSQDTVTVEAKYMNPWDTKPIGKLIFRTNYKPRIVGQDDGIWRRTKLIPFTQDFQGREDRDLGAKLLRESSGILGWLVEGCLLWQAEGLALPEQVRQASAEYRTEQDTLAEFFLKNLERGDGSYTIKKERAYELYRPYAEAAGERVMGKIEFGRKLADYPGISDGVDSGGQARIWKGIREKRPGGFDGF
jgi:putative DNA primase/helicase